MLKGSLAYTIWYSCIHRLFSSRAGRGPAHTLRVACFVLHLLLYAQIKHLGVPIVLTAWALASRSED